RSGRDQVTVTGSDNRVDLAAANLTLNNIEVLDAAGIGSNSVVLSVDAVRRVTDQNNQLLVKTGIDDSVNIGQGWTLTDAKVIDGELVRILTQDDVTLRSIGPSEWTNPVNALDVNGDGNVSAIDALGVINDLARRGLLDNDGNLLPAGQDGVFRGRFVDVLARGFFSARDALVIINALARQQTTGEGEQLSAANSVQQVMQLLDSSLMHTAERESPQKSTIDVEAGLADPIVSPPTETRQELRSSATPKKSPTTFASQNEFEKSTGRTRAVDEFFRLLTER
ncbi:MAG: dockerin type I domain-containing protein, partial [Planctomycetota bacterium]